MAHHFTRNPPHGALWRRGTERRRGQSPLRHEELVVLLGLSGRGQYLLDDTEIAVRPGTLVWAPPGSAHMLVSDGPGFDMLVVLAHPKLWGGVSTGTPGATTGTIPGPLLAISGHRHLAPDGVVTLDRLALDLQQTDPVGLGFGLCWWLWRAQDLWHQAPLEGGQKWHPAVARVALAIHHDPAAPLETLCADCGLSRGYFAQLFRKQTGHGLVDFRAMRQLERVDIAVWEGASLLGAAMDAGFGSYPQFFRVFRALRGQAPRAYYAQREKGISPDRPG